MKSMYRLSRDGDRWLIWKFSGNGLVASVVYSEPSLEAAQHRMHQLYETDASQTDGGAPKLWDEG